MPSILAAVKTGIETTEVQRFERPEVTAETGLLRMEAAGVGGSDPEFYRMTRGIPAIMGHENVGVVEDLGPLAAQRWGLKRGDRIALQEYLPCHHCRWCRRGDFRLCPQTDFFGPGKTQRYGQMDCTQPPHLWGGYSEYLYLPSNIVFHAVPPQVSSQLATLAVPLGNGWQWSVLDGGVTPGKVVLVFGPGQQGLGCVIASHAAGASKVILAGKGPRDQARLALARKLGAEHVIDVESEDLEEGVKDFTAGAGVDVVVDTTGDPEGSILRSSLALAAPFAQLNLNGLSQSVPLKEVKAKSLLIRAPRGRSYRAVELAMATIASGRFPLEEMCTHRFGLKDTHTAILATAGRGMPDAIHVVVDPTL
jgi:threonine dehydrogenase-like Zn-dependent dehydrogenase